MRASLLLDAVMGRRVARHREAGDWARGNRKNPAPEDGSDAEVVHDGHTSGVCDAVSQNLRRATSFSNRRQQDREKRYERCRRAVNALNGARDRHLDVGFLPARGRPGLLEWGV
jgi:hypothetical protein